MNKISAKDLELLMKEGKEIHIIDVREADEVAEGKIPGAKHIPLGLVENHLHELDKSKEYYISLSFRRKKRSRNKIPCGSRL